MSRGAQRLRDLMREHGIQFPDLADHLGVADAEEFFRTLREGRPPSVPLRCFVEHWSRGAVAFADWDKPAEVKS